MSDSLHSRRGKKENVDDGFVQEGLQRNVFYSRVAYFDNQYGLWNSHLTNKNRDDIFRNCQKGLLLHKIRN